jgi:hypothetical protein
VLARLSALFASLALLAAIAGCGGGGSSSGESSSDRTSQSGETSKATFIEEADAVCSRYKAERKPIEAEIETVESSGDPESPKNLRRLGELLNEALVAAEGELASLRELQPPQADEATVEKMLDTAEEGHGLGAEAADALEAGQVSRFGELRQEVQAINDRAKRMAESYGFKVCGQAP